MKRNQAPSKRSQKQDSTKGRVIQDKFLVEREVQVKSKALVPMNDRQREYIEELKEKQIVVATGLAGTSKSYIPAVMAADLYKLGKIKKIMLTRPAISNSQTLGFFKGSEAEKLGIWLGSVLPIFKERLGIGMFDIAVAKQDISFIPLEVVKGLSLDDTWFICEEASDLTKDEVIKLVTRLGKDSHLTLAGDIRQSELKHDSGLVWLSGFLKRNKNLDYNFGFVDFESTDHIVRSKTVKEFMISVLREESKTKQAKE